MIETLGNLLFILVFFLLASGIGMKLLSTFKSSPQDLSGEIALGSGLGLGVLAYSVLALGLVGILYPWAVLVVVVLLGILSFSEIRRLITRFVGAMCQATSFSGIFDRAVLVLLISAAFATLLSALGPELGNDALCYHMEDPKIFIRNHRIEFLPFSENSLFPYLVQMLFSMGLLLKGAVAAKLFHTLMGFLTVMAVYSWEKKLAGPRCALLASAAFLLTPGINNQMGTAYIDVGLALMTCLSYYAFYLWFESRDRKWLILTGVFSGFSLSIKYQGVYSCFVIFMTLVLVTLLGGKTEESKAKALAGNLAIYGAFTILCSFVWYLRSYLHLGTPIFPYFTPNYGGEPYDLNLGKHGVGKSPLNYLLLFWNLTMHPDLFGGVGNQYGLLFLVFLPFLLVAKWPRAIRFVLFLAWAHVTVWFCFRHNIRYLFPVVPLLSLLTAFAIKNLKEKGRALSWMTSILTLFILLLHSAIALYHQREVYKVPLGLETPESYLSRTERSFAFAQEVNRRVPATEKILNAEEIRAFYFKPWMIREKIYRRVTRYAELIKDEEGVIEFLKKEGFQYLVIKETEEPTESSPSLGIRDLVKKQGFVDRYLEEVVSSTFQRQEEGEVRYFLYRIRG